MNLEYVVKKEERLLEFLYNNIPKYSKKEIKSFLAHGSILVDNKVVTQFDYVLKANQIIRINKYNKIKDINIIYEDNDIIVVDKKEGILTIATDKQDEITMYKLVSEYVKSKNKKNKIFIIHRLDKETSGVLMFAKSEKIKKLYQDNWDNLVLKREYIAIVNGKTQNSGTIKSYLKENNNYYVYSAKDGKLAITRYKKIKEDNKYTWLLVNIDTGRKNQIRVHMKDLGNPIVGDLKYGKKDSKYKRLCLHASKLVLINPITKKQTEYIAETPHEFNLK